MARVYGKAESLGNTTIGSSSETEKVTLTFTPNASKNYLIGGMAVITGMSVTTADRTVSLTHKSNSNTVLQEWKNFRPKDASDDVAFPCYWIYEANATPSSETFAIYLQAASGSFSTTINKSRLWYLELTANDVYSVYDVSSSTIVPAERNNMNVPAGDWILVGSALGSAAGNANTRIEIQNKTDGVTLFDSNTSVDYLQATTSGSFGGPIATVLDLSLNATKELIWYFEGFAAGKTSVVVYYRGLVFCALDRAGFANTYYAEQSAATTLSGTGSTTANTRTTLSETVTAGDHLVVGTWELKNSSSTLSVLSDFTEDGTSVTGTLEREATGSYFWMMGHYIDIADLTAASHTFNIRWWNESTSSTSTIKYAHIAVLDVENTGGGGPPVATYAPMINQGL